MGGQPGLPRAAPAWSGGCLPAAESLIPATHCGRLDACRRWQDDGLPWYKFTLSGPTYPLTIRQSCRGRAIQSIRLSLRNIAKGLRFNVNHGSRAINPNAVRLAPETAVLTRFTKRQKMYRSGLTEVRSYAYNARHRRLGLDPLLGLARLGFPSQ